MLLCVLGTALSVPASVHAQDARASAAWVPAETPPAAFAPAAPASTHHEVRRGGIFTGIALLAIGYVGSVIWGSYYLGSRHLGVLGCNDLYGGFHFLPIAGALIGMFAGGACVPDQLHVEEGIMPVVFTVPQLAGLVALIIGAAGHEVPDMPAMTVQLDANGGTMLVGGTF
jgi:hypothetical protein